jgi:hypothetical protein
MQSISSSEDVRPAQKQLSLLHNVEVHQSTTTEEFDTRTAIQRPTFCLQANPRSAGLPDHELLPLPLLHLHHLAKNELETPQEHYGLERKGEKQSSRRNNYREISSSPHQWLCVAIIVQLRGPSGSKETPVIW